jgi:biotin operon repressor
MPYRGMPTAYERVYAALSSTTRKTVPQIARETGLSQHVVRNQIYTLKQQGRAARPQGKQGFSRPK